MASIPSRPVSDRNALLGEFGKEDILRDTEDASKRVQTLRDSAPTGALLALLDSTSAIIKLVVEGMLHLLHKLATRILIESLVIFSQRKTNQ